MRTTTVSTMFLALSTAIAAAADPVDQFCQQVSRNIDTLASTFQTACVPTAGGKPGVNSALLIADAPVFGAEKSKKAFLIVACVAAGSEMNANARLRLNELWFSDVERTKQRIAYSLPAAECKSLQAQVHAGKLPLETMYTRIESKLVRRDVGK